MRKWRARRRHLRPHLGQGWLATSRPARAFGVAAAAVCTSSNRKQAPPLRSCDQRRGGPAKGSWANSWGRFRLSQTGSSGERQSIRRPRPCVGETTGQRGKARQSSSSVAPPWPVECVCRVAAEKAAFCQNGEPTPLQTTSWNGTVAKKLPKPASRAQVEATWAHLRPLAWRSGPPAVLGHQKN